MIKRVPYLLVGVMLALLALTPLYPPQARADTCTGEGTLVAGDSYTVGSQAAIMSKYPQITVRAQVGAQADWGKSQINEDWDKGIVFLFGTNGNYPTTILDEVKKHSKNGKIAVMTVWAPKSNVQNTAKALNNNVKSWASSNGAHLMDWESLSTGKADYFASDQIHPSGAGREAFNTSVFAAIDAVCQGSSTTDNPTSKPSTESTDPDNITSDKQVRGMPPDTVGHETQSQNKSQVKLPTDSNGLTGEEKTNLSEITDTYKLENSSKIGQIFGASTSFLGILLLLYSIIAFMAFALDETFQFGAVPLVTLGKLRHPKRKESEEKGHLASWGNISLLSGSSALLGALLVSHKIIEWGTWIILRLTS